MSPKDKDESKLHSEVKEASLKTICYTIPVIQHFGKRKKSYIICIIYNILICVFVSWVVRKGRTKCMEE